MLLQVECRSTWVAKAGDTDENGARGVVPCLISRKRSFQAAGRPACSSSRLKSSWCRRLSLACSMLRVSTDIFGYVALPSGPYTCSFCIISD